MPRNKDYSAVSILDMMKAQFGDAVTSTWLYADELCPCCQKHPIDAVHYRGQKALSINGFMYRDQGVLIGYFLCEQCALRIHATAKFGPSSLHKAIEANLIGAYHRYIASLDA